MSFLRHFRPVSIALGLAKRYPAQTALVTGAIIVASLLESLSIMSILPLIILLFQGGQELNVTALPQFLQPLFTLIGSDIQLGQILIFIAVGFGAKALLMIGMMRYVLTFLAQMQQDYRRQIILNLFHAKWLYFGDLSLGALTNSIGAEITTLATVYRQCVEMVSATVQVGFYIIISVALSLPATLFAVAFGVVMTILLRGFIRRTRVTGGQYTDSLKLLSSRIADVFISIKSIRAMAKERFVEPLLMTPSTTMQDSHKHYALNFEIVSQLQQWFMVIGISLMMYIFVHKMQLQMTGFMFLAIIFQRIAAGLSNMQRNYQQIARNERSVTNIEELLATSLHEQEHFSGTKKIDLAKDIRFNDISFSYGDRRILTQVSLQIAKGQRIALIGPSGSGKSTLIDLLTGLQQPQGGTVMVDGTVLDEMDIRHWRQSIGYVPQDTLLLHDTIANNVGLNDPSITQDMIADALKAAEIWTDIQSWPDGVNTMVGERGIKLSGGQRQRIALARALVKKPRLLILDEATAALDPETEQRICETITHLGRDVTVIAISHQKALSRIADQVYMIEQGRVLPVTANAA